MKHFFVSKNSLTTGASGILRRLGRRARGLVNALEEYQDGDKERKAGKEMLV